MPRHLTIGAEEEYLVVDHDTLALVPRSHELLPAAADELGSNVEPELNLCQIEVSTPVCEALDDIDHHLRELRRGLTAVAEPLGLAIAPIGAHPFTSWEEQRIDVARDRYQRINDVYRIVARQQVICGFHAHVGIDDPELVIEVMNRVRPWVSVLLALSASSPYWRGIDTGFASYRLQVWQRWPTSGMPPTLSGRAEYDELMASLVGIDAIEDPTFVYWYVRPSDRYPTIEFRLCDALVDVDDAVTIVGLMRALVASALVDVRSDRPETYPRAEVMEAMVWRAARYGLDGTLVDPRTMTCEPAADVVHGFVDRVAQGLDSQGDTERVRQGVRELLARGNGATLQRRQRALDRSPSEVLRLLLVRAGGTAGQPV